MENFSYFEAVKEEEGSSRSTTMEILESLSNGGGASVPSATTNRALTASPPEPKTFDDIDFSQYYVHDSSPVKNADENPLFTFFQDGSCSSFGVPDNTQPESTASSGNSNAAMTDHFGSSSVFENAVSTEQEEQAALALAGPSTSAATATEPRQIELQTQGMTPGPVPNPQQQPPQAFIYGYVYYGEQYGFVPLVAMSTTSATVATSEELQQPSSSTAQGQGMQSGHPFYSFYPQAALPSTSSTATCEQHLHQQQQAVFFSGLVASQDSQPFQPTPSRRSYKRKSVPAPAATSADGAEEDGLAPNVVPELKAQGTFTLSGEKIRRPPNAFMIFAKGRRRELLYSNRALSNKDVSRMLGHEWRDLSEEEREGFKVAANELRREHQAKYPGYCYNPMVARRAKQERKLKNEQKRKQSAAAKGHDNESNSISSGSFDSQQVVLEPAEADWPPEVFSSSQASVSSSVSATATVAEDHFFDFDESELYNSEEDSTFL
ncbi:hypothetical protein TYRP_018518 [Tyrophagus putrescentiae]|nr:hypothetical protein TYRP_018518 [Tyrophagus putrescentiae]